MKPAGAEPCRKCKGTGTVQKTVGGAKTPCPACVGTGKAGYRTK